MQLIKASDVIVTEARQRSVMPLEHVKKLASAILKVGLLHPIVLRDDCKTLVAGESRLRAVLMLERMGEGFEHDGSFQEAGMIPFTTLKECDQALAEEAELLENAIRLDLTWQDRDAAVLRIKNLLGNIKQAQGDDSEPTAREVGKYMAEQKTGFEGEAPKSAVSAETQKVSAAVLRSQYADDVRVKNAKTVKEADKIIRKDLEAKHREKLAATFKDVQTEHVIKQGDCCELIKGVSSGTYDVIVSDPIYGIDANGMHMFQTAKLNEGGHHQYDDSVENWDKMFKVMPEELFRVAKDEAALYMFCDINRFFDFTVTLQGLDGSEEDLVVMPGLKTRLEMAGWRVWPRPLVWFKGNIGSIPRPEHGPRYTSEYIIYATKGDKKVTGIFYDVINIPQTTGHTHAAGKPPEVYLDLLKRSALPGDLVLDFNAGSFPILPAANSLGCTAHAWELDGKWIKDGELRKTLKVGESHE